MPAVVLPAVIVSLCLLTVASASTIEDPSLNWASSPAVAPPAPTSSAQGASAPVTARTWLDAQASGQYASPNRVTLSGAALERIHQGFLSRLSGASSKAGNNTSAAGAGSGSSSGAGSSQSK